MATASYYKHDFSPFIFTVKSFTQEGLATAGIVLLILSFCTLWLWPRMRALSDAQRDVLDLLRPLLVFSTIIIGVLFGL